MKKISFFWLIPVLFFLFLTVFLFRPFFFKGLVPIPGDILIGHYYPWKDHVWQGREAGYPIKNFLLFDGIRQTLPWRLLAIDQIKAGHWPLWNPYILSGMPLLGNLQTAAFYPLNFIFFLFPPLKAWSIYVLLQPFLAGMFTYFLVKDLTKNDFAGMLSGICFGFSSIMMNHLEFGIDGHTILWLPLSILAVNKIQEKFGFRWLLLLIFSVLMSLFGGYPPPAVYGLMVIFLYSLIKIRPLFSKKILCVGLGVVFALALSSPQLLPAIELSGKIIREETQFGILSKEAYFLPFENLLMLIAPDFFGHPSTNNFFSKINYADNPSIGVVGLLFALFAFFSLKKKETKFWILTAILPLLLMTPNILGTGLRLLKINFISLVTPLRMVWIVSFSLSILAGIGLIEIKKIVEKKSFWRFFLPIFFLWEFFFISWVLSFSIPEKANIFISQRNLIIPTFIYLLTCFSLIFVFFKPSFFKLIIIVCLLISAGELIRQGIKYNPFIDPSLVFPPVKIFESIKDIPLYRTLITHPELLPANSNIAYRLPMIDGYASMQDGRYGQMIKIANSKYPLTELEGYPRVVFQTGYGSDLIDLFGVKYILSLKDLSDKKLKIINQVGETRIYENMQVFPKAFFVGNFLVEKDSVEIANQMLKVDLSKTVILEKNPQLSSQFKNYQDAEIEIINYLENQITLETKNEEEGILVINDSFDSGWKAFINNNPVEIFRANFDLRAIIVPAGENEILFSYQPDSFRVGRWLSFISLLFLFTLFIFDFKLGLLKKK